MKNVRVIRGLIAIIFIVSQNIFANMVYGQVFTPFYFGRWVANKPVRDAEGNWTGVPIFSSKNGSYYRIIDIAPCGSDTFCGVSVLPDGKCSITLFRFYNKHFHDKDEDILVGHAVWGNRKVQIMLTADADSDGKNARIGFELHNHDHSIYEPDAEIEADTIVGEEYHRGGEAKCFAR